jgi:hypothetical protein
MVGNGDAHITRASVSESHMIGGKHSQERKEFCRIRIPNSQFARRDLILK